MSEDNIQCKICTESYDTESRVKTLLPCNHILCKSCMLDNFKNSNRCPFCRREMKIIINKTVSKQSHSLLENQYYIINNQLLIISLANSLIGLSLSLLLLIFISYRFAIS